MNTDTIMYQLKENNMMKQKDAVVSTVLSVLTERNVEYVLGGEIPITDVLTKQDITEVKACVLSMFVNEECGFKDEVTKAKHFETDATLRKYVNGLCDNHIRKTKEFHCGNTYKAKNPGSRAGNSDPQIKALKALLTQTTESDQIAQINEAIAERQTAIAVEKAKSVVINVNDLPDHLKAFVKS